MSKPPREIRSTDDFPEFFKIFTPDQCSQRLRIPPDFVEYFEEESPRRFILKSRKDEFCVIVNKVGDSLFLDKGWELFVKDHCLEFGDFIVFSYVGSSMFYVTVFGTNSCRKPIENCNSSSNKAIPMFQEGLENQSNGSELKELDLIPVDDSDGDS